MEVIKNLASNIDWLQFMTAVWTIILVPIGKQIYDYLKTKKVDKYADILYEELYKAVIGTYESQVKDIKDNPELWTEEKQAEVREYAKDKAIFGITNSAYKILKTANKDFDEWLDAMVDTVLYEVKHK